METTLRETISKTPRFLRERDWAEINRSSHERKSAKGELQVGSTSLISVDGPSYTTCSFERAYVAKVLGEDKKYVWKREFLEKEKKGNDVIFPAPLEVGAVYEFKNFEYITEKAKVIKSSNLRLSSASGFFKVKNDGSIAEVHPSRVEDALRDETDSEKNYNEKVKFTKPSYYDNMVRAKDSWLSSPEANN